MWKVAGYSQCMLSHFSRVWLCTTPQTAGHQPPPMVAIKFAVSKLIQEKKKLELCCQYKR